MARVQERGLLYLIRRGGRTPIPADARTDLAVAVSLLGLFLIQVFTGILLSLYYQPSPELVSDSVQFIMRDVTSGWLVRGLHHWSSPALAMLCALHLLRVFAGGRYRGGQAWIWYVGLSVLALVLAEAFTGDILNWDNIAYWRLRHLLESIESMFGVGPTVADILRGGPEVGATTLSRAYSAHTLFVPWLAWMLLVINLSLLARRIFQRDGGAA